ncbi:MAG: RNA polymerase sigma factor [Saprospiraceae bacterium]|nr:RNA polymerase sigma factor [Saprospiraceae bacterium]
MQASGSNVGLMTDEDLIEEFQHTHANVFFSELYVRYYEKVKLYCLKSLGNLSLAEDISQEVMLKAYEKISSLRNANLWVAWLFSIARNQVLNQHKQRSRWHLEREELAYKIADGTDDVARKLEKESKLQALPCLLDNPEMRILKLKYIEGKSIEQLCSQMHMKESAVKMKLLRDRQKVVKMYESQRAWA